MFAFACRLTVIVCISLLAGGCESAYYGAWEKLGWEKRDILVDRVKEARDEQNEAKEQFQTTLERLQALTNFQGGELEARYKDLSAQYERSAARAGEVTERIDSVQDVAQDLFAEWRQEIKQYESSELRQLSEQKLRDTEARYRQLMAAMRRAEGAMRPVLARFKDQVLFLKHNLNAQAIASLQTTSAQIESDVSELIREMEASIAEANAFIKDMK